MSLEQHSVCWDPLKQPICLPPHDLCTHNIFTVSHHSSYFSLTLIIEMRHLARLNEGPVVASWRYDSPWHWGITFSFLFFNLIPVLGLSGPVPHTNTGFYLWKCKLIPGTQRAESVEHCWSLERNSVSQKKMGLSEKTSAADLSTVPRVGSWPRPSLSHPTSIVPLFIVKTKIIGGSSELDWRRCDAILNSCIRFYFTYFYMSEHLSI